MKPKNRHIRTEEEMAAADAADPIFQMFESGMTINEICDHMGWPRYPEDPEAYLKQLDEEEAKKKKA